MNFKILLKWYHKESHTFRLLKCWTFWKYKQLPPLYTTVTTWNKLNMYTKTEITWIKYCNECQFLETLVAFWGTWTDKSHGHSTMWLTAQQFIIRYRMPEQTVHVLHPVYNPVAQGNRPHSLARLPTIYDLLGAFLNLSFLGFPPLLCLIKWY